MKVDVERLRTAIDKSRKKLAVWRRRHMEALEQLVGGWYSDEGADKHVHMNLIELATNIYDRQLAAQPPMVDVTTHVDRARPSANKLKMLMNARLQDFTIYRELRRAVRSALFSIGIVKVGLRNLGSYNVDNYEFAKTEPFVEQVLIDDWVHDMRARRYSQVDYAGHRYRMTYEEVKDNTDFLKSERDKIKPGNEPSFDEDGVRRAYKLSIGTGDEDIELYKKVDLWEIWLPREQKVLTLWRGGDRPLRVVDWDGPPGGPFHLLWFNEVDGQLMPLAPAMTWRGLHEIANAGYRKLDREARNLKHVGLARLTDSSDAETIMRLSDGEVGSVQNPEAILSMNFGGIDQQLLAFVLLTVRNFKLQAGNLDALGGLGPQSETLGQDQLLASTVNQRIAGMQQSVMLFTKEVLTDWGYYLWSDPVQSYPVTMRLEGINEYETQFDTNERSSSYWLNELDVKPYSMQFRSPMQDGNLLMQLVTNFLIPALPFMQTQGQTLDVSKMVKIFSEKFNLPELDDIVVQAEELKKGLGGQARQSPMTTRRNERINRNAGEGEAADNEIIRAALGGSQFSGGG